MSSGARPTASEGFGRRILQRFTEPAALRTAFRRARPDPLTLDLDTEEFGRAEAGERLIAGRFDSAGKGVSCEPGASLWRAKDPSLGWLIEAHSFEWLADLAAVGGERAEQTGRRLFDTWLREIGFQYDHLIWRDDVAARRLRALLLHANFALPQDSTRKSAAQRAIVAHGHWLIRRVEGLPAGTTQLRGAVALAELSLAAASWREQRNAVAGLVDAALSSGILADGCPLSRNPEDALILLAQTRLLLQGYEREGVDPPPLLEAAVEALALAVRFFRSADGGLPLFHGGAERADGRVELELGRRRLPYIAPQSMSEGRFERVAGGRVTVMIDLGGAPGGPAAETGAASMLAFEMTAGRRRLVVNSGSAAHLDPDWALASRGESAHSTLTFNDSPFSQMAPPPGSPEARHAPLLSGPIGAAGERMQEKNGVWVAGGHDGYLDEYGVQIARRLFLSADGGDFRGEDSAMVGQGRERLFERRLAKLPRAQRRVGFPFTARFHLHPTVKASLVADGEAVTMRLPSGEIWVMRQAGGDLSLEPSVYYGRGDAPEESQQIVVTAAARETLTQIRWAFRRVGDINSLPKDIEALEPQDEFAAADARRALRRPPLPA